MRQGNNNRRPRRGGAGGGGGGGGSGGGGGGGNHGRRNNVPLRHQNFDSNGPDVRIRGNAYQVHEKYLQLARDAAAAGDRVQAENYFQHAEHYYRIILQINEQQAAEQRQRQPHQNGGNGHQPMANGNGGNGHDAEAEDGDEFEDEGPRPVM